MFTQEFSEESVNSSIERISRTEGQYGCNGFSLTTHWFPWEKRRSGFKCSALQTKELLITTAENSGGERFFPLVGQPASLSSRTGGPGQLSAAASSAQFVVHSPLVRAAAGKSEIESPFKSFLGTSRVLKFQTRLMPHAVEEECFYDLIRGNTTDTNSSSCWQNLPGDSLSAAAG